jgi:hypothetical protein
METNPLTARVIVNRLWHHVFGRGLVSTTDNFGKLGELPSHPQLLDFLAQKFIDSGGSVKALLRMLVSTQAFRRQANSPQDPENRYLSGWTMRRLEAEAVRDSILSLGDQLSTELYGPPVAGNVARRSIYVKVIRNALDPFLNTFDSPVPASTRGKRDSTNVPAQSLTLLNDANVIRWARNWAARTDNVQDEIGRIAGMFQAAYHRRPTANELTQSQEFLASVKQAVGAREQEIKHLRALEQQMTEILGPARERLQANHPPPPDAPKPLLEWTFEPDANDPPLSLEGAARLENGALVVDGKSMAKSGSLPKTLTAKTLEAWVQLANLTQQGGGIISMQEKDGGVFDAITFAEHVVGRWEVGSDFFNRSKLLEGPLEQEALTKPVHVAMVYQADGTIAGYRGGLPYGEPFRKANGVTFAAEESQILFGCRHGSPNGNHGLSGRIYRARVYERALTAAEISLTAQVEATSISDTMVITSLPPEQQETLRQRKSEHAKLVAATQSASSLPADVQAWASLAHSLINLKEFIYLR